MFLYSPPPLPAATPNEQQRSLRREGVSEKKMKHQHFTPPPALCQYDYGFVMKL